MKKRIIILTLVFVMILMQSVSAATMYALDGRTIEVDDSEIEAYRQVNWYYGKPVTMYAPDGRTLTVGENDVEMYKAVGWYTERPVTMYALDGRRAVVPASQISAWENVGWYSEPVTYMYAGDGRRIVVMDSEIAANKRVGWYEAHDIAMGKTLKQVDKIFGGIDFLDIWRGGNNYYNKDYIFAIPAGSVCCEVSEQLCKLIPSILYHTDKNGRISKYNFEKAIGYGGYAYINDESHDFGYSILYYLKGYAVEVPCDSYGNIDTTNHVLIYGY